MSAIALIVVLVALGFSYAIVGAVCRVAASKNLLDVPNERSSHSVATPRGGGIGIVIAFLLTTSALGTLHLVSGSLWFALVLSSSAIAIVGYLDDRYHLGAVSRFMVHVLAATLFVAIAGGFPADELLKWGLKRAWLGSAFSVLAAVWATNLFNFMDGIDGIAASESIFITVSAGALILFNGGDPGLASVLFSLAAASLGFLFWNWPPARIFMGDVGSGFLGFVIFACLMSATIKGDLPIEELPILGGVFIVDSTITLLRRILQRDRFLEPHRTHAYQWMARRFGGHRPVTVIVILTDALWLFPWALATSRDPDHGRYYLTAALLPLVIIAMFVGAGRRESRSVSQ